MIQALPYNPVLVFDIETVADIDAARRIYPELVDLNEADALTALQAIRIQETGRDFMRIPLQRIVCISAFYVQGDKTTLFSLSAEHLSEQEILRKFFKAFNDFPDLPQLVSWNGSGFDIPVLIYRAMLYDLSVPLLFEDGDNIQSMRFNNYVNRYQDRHLDLMDRFSQFGASQRQSMNVVASLYGLPGKTNIDGSMVGDLVAADKWQTLTVYCESDVLNTWLIYLRWLRLTGKLSSEGFNAWQQQTRDYLAAFESSDDGVRHQEFIADWAAAAL
ncbi:3'-5' exonuclease [Psychrobacter frigidicola]|uniref:3'-5' exonuclease n=1 Tax=Psychrobacter frigidicola TaxID=45611 RepID=A0A5C7A3F5_9GAMM|nr:3'-5' exonuclease [Psychrobacter frigidicola]TXD97122.1 3'-5' exonuclease [Psychrobacter frigidicola]